MKIKLRAKKNKEKKCPFCHDILSDPSTKCEDCFVEYHDSCLEEFYVCGTPGCENRIGAGKITPSQKLKNYDRVIITFLVKLGLFFLPAICILMISQSVLIGALFFTLWTLLFCLLFLNKIREA